MASPSISLYLILLTLLSTANFCFPRSNLNRPIPLNSPNTDVHDLLPKYGLPRGLLPDNVKSYTLSNDGAFEIELYDTCYIKFDRLVYYEKTVKGKISRGKVSDVSGIQAKKGFFWVSISGIIAHPEKNKIEFKVGFLSEELSAQQFEVVRSCDKNSLLPYNPLLQSI
ncbi:hypothetical protein L484_016699 [Morus notabilis]|uniref:DUF538 domain-containing protein n=1 Tax=Morus notabilis TaxID=981085 RepID=W9RQ50_9ROSA|nr:uncharacterized protein LOC21399737 [Morus notabilis]XP_024024448.1 uncharacterized protein LOC21399737 [Morus notabilis]EXB87353.1 hypothetical protein L484_016699 [Morus notabilis]